MLAKITLHDCSLMRIHTVVDSLSHRCRLSCCTLLTVYPVVVVLGLHAFFLITNIYQCTTRKMIYDNTPDIEWCQLLM
jgi:hypothetical protein